MALAKTILEQYLSKEELEHYEKGLNAAETNKIENRLKELYQAMVRYLPSAILGREKEDLRKGCFQEQAVLVADISGFTTLSEKLSHRGRAGAEEVTEIINRFFSPLVKIVFRHGGDLLRFSGDALAATFSEIPSVKESKELRAVLTAWKIQDFLKNFPEVETSVGAFPLSMHFAIHSGKTLGIELGTPEIDLEYALVGPEINHLITLEEKSALGEILFSETIFKKVKSEVKAEEKEKGIYQLKEVSERQEIPEVSLIERIPKGIENLVSEIERLKAHLPPGLFEKIKSDPKSERIYGEHRRVTTLFLNLWGLNYEKDLKAAENLQAYFSEVQGIVQKYEGTIDKIDFTRQGERIMILFGAPVAHENDEERASLCGLEILSGVWAKTLGIPQKIGINSGYVFAGNIGSKTRQEYTVMGDEVNIAARLMETAKKSELLVTESVWAKIKKKFETQKEKPITVKGKTEPLEVYQVTKEKVGIEDIFARWMSESKILVGREKEQSILSEIVEKVLAGRGQIVSITGEAGIGKSRLVRELSQKWMSQGYTVFGGNCQSYGSSIFYLPWAELMEDYLGIKKVDSPEEKRKKIEKNMVIVNPKLSEWTPIIGELLNVPIEETSLTKSLDAKLRQQRLFDITLEMLTWGAAQEPLMLILEDLHWADTTSLEMLNYIGRNIANKRILIALVYRSLEGKWEFREKEHHTEIALPEFTSDESKKLAATLLTVEGMPKEIEEFISKKTQGNPFFIEEVIKSLIERGVIKKEDGLLKLQTGLDKLEIPDTIQGVIMSRLDRLSAETKNVLQVASVLGRQFNYSLLEGIYPKREGLKEHLQTLNRLDLILLEPANQYLFKHIMTQEVAYESLSFGRRRELHIIAGEYIEGIQEKNIEEAYGILTHHFYQGRSWEKAFYYAIEAGDKAKKVYANQEALNYYDKALEVFDQMGEEGLLPGIMKEIQEELKEA
ncbi:MAG: adenylate/guanylate cyclase domain-containing protein [Candidatus Edwardsbacteria bacterium]